MARPDCHLRVSDDWEALLDAGPRHLGHRPAIDVLFGSAAEVAGCGAIAVLLSGNDTDGTVGATHVASNGGTVLVQAPSEAAYPRMPAGAVQRDHPDLVIPSDGIGRELCRRVGPRR